MKKKLLLILIFILTIVFTFSARSIFADPADTNTVPVILQDTSNGMMFSIQLTSGQSDTGQFDLYIPQKGYYQGKVELREKIKCDEKEDCLEDEDDKKNKSKVIHLKDTLTVWHYQTDDNSGSEVKVKIEGKINTFSNSAIINIWIEGNHYRLKTKKADQKAAEEISIQVAQYTTTRDWPALYDLLSAQIQSSMTQEEFIQIMSQTNSPEIIAINLNGEGKIFPASGNSYFAQPVSLTVRQEDSSTKLFNSTQYFIFEDTWRFLSTDTPVVP